jgi:uroporphyrin-III C-methyltransferase
MGKVFLVGAGPGDPDLLTVKAARILAAATVVLHDALVTPAILALAPQAEHIDIGKRCGRKLLTQSEINDLLIAHSRKGGSVVRLKGGDPSIFGRAGEEIAALLEAGIEFEIVPGVSTALAAAASAKISLTDRRYASAVTFMTGHRRPGDEEVEWNRLVTSGSTLAIYMPGSNYGEIVANLRSAGLDVTTPCVVISHAGRREEQKLFTDLASLAVAQPLPAPSLLIVGQCARSLDTVDLAPKITSNFEARSRKEETV